jgi:hypothetical protein
MTRNVNDGPVDAKGQRPVGVRHLLISRFVYADGGIAYRAMPLDRRDTPEDSIEMAINGLGLLVHTVAAYTDDHENETLRLAKQMLSNIAKGGGIAQTWPRAEQVKLPDFNWTHEQEKDAGIPPGIPGGDQGGETAPDSITGSV